MNSGYRGLNVERILNISKPFNSKLLTGASSDLIDNHKRLKQFFGDKITLSKESVSEVDKGFVERFRELIEANLIDSELSVEELGSKMGLSRVQLYRKIKALTNILPMNWCVLPD